MDINERRRFEETTLPHLDAAYNLARWLTQDDHAAEDVVQDASCRAAKYFHSFRGGSARPWFLSIVRRVAFDWLEQRRSKQTVAFTDELHDRTEDTLNPEYLAIRQANAALVRQALDELAAPLREAIVLREMEMLTYHEIATVTDVALGTVMSRLSRARQQLQRRLASAAGND